MRSGGLAAGLQWAAAGRALPGEFRSGDDFTVQPREDGVLALVVDGLGHGEEAHVASTRIVAAARERPNESLERILDHCHSSSRQTRGGTVSLALIQPRVRQLQWLGVGDVAALCIRPGGGRNPEAREHLISASGVVGYRFAKPRLRTVPFGRGDLLLLATDGIRTDFTEGLNEQASPEELVRAILSDSARPTDDALVVAVRFAEPSAEPSIA